MPNTQQKETINIGLITLFNENYGSILQAYATKTFLESLGCKCDIFQITPSNNFFEKLKRKINILTKIIFCPSFYRLFVQTRKGALIDSCNPVNQTRKMMDEFVQNELHPLKVSTEEINSSVWQKKYDYFITGSDQVWNTKLFVNPINFLQFTSSSKKIALAVSFGITNIPKYNRKALTSALKGFDYISVREESGIKIVKQFSNAKVIRIADPTLIYTNNEWRQLIKEEAIPSLKYILVHFLNQPNSTAIESIKYLSTINNFKIIIIGYNYDVLSNIKDSQFINGNPWKYLSLIDNSEFVITDSFHTTLFSINFNKEFFVFERHYSTINEGSRINDLLDRFDLKERFITRINDLKPNDKTKYNSFIAEERRKIRDYIQKSISGQIPQCFLQGDNNAK